MKRKSGWYWVLYHGNWEIAKYNSHFNEWSFKGKYSEDVLFDQIDPTPITRTPTDKNETE